MNRRMNLYMAIEQGILAAMDGYGYYEPVRKDSATSLILRSNKLEGEDEEVVVVDFSNLDGVLIYQGRARRNQYGLQYYNKRTIQNKSDLRFCRCLYYESNEEPEKWLNMPEKVVLREKYRRVQNITVAELVFIGYKVYQSKITGNSIGNEVELWLNDKEYIIEKARQEQEQGLSVYGYILRKQRSQPENSIATEPIATEPVGVAEIDDKEIAMFPLFSKEEAVECISRLRAAFFKGRGENV